MAQGLERVLRAMQRWAARPWFLAWLLASAACAQALGSLHGVAHALHVQEPQVQAIHAQAAPGSAEAAAHPDTADAQPGPQPGLIASLFALHDDAPDCRILDGLGQHAPVEAVHTVAPQPMPGSLVRRLQHGAFVARWAALFDARGPPHAPRAFH